MALFGGERLAKVDPRLVALFSRVSRDHDLLIIQGDRSVVEEVADEHKGASELSDPYNSKHVIGPKRLLAEAADVAPYPINWNNIPAFQALAAAVKATAQQQGVLIVWGGDWLTLRDYSHYELA